MKKLLALAIALRILVSVFYFHPDIKTIYFQTSFLKHGVFNIYTHLIQNRANLPLKEEFVYFPLAYFTLGSYQTLASPVLGSNFESWLFNASSNQVVVDQNAFWYLFLMKLPYLFLDIWIAFLIKQFFDRKEDADKAFTLWLFNPFTIFLIYVYSNVDIFAVTLTILSFLSLKKEKSLLAGIFLGLAAGFKLYPLIFTPFLFIYARSVKEKLYLSLAPWFVFLALCLPFFSADFVHSALVSGLSTGVLNSQVAVMALSFIVFLVWNKKFDPLNLWVLIYLIIFSFPLYHIQWLLWIAPFLVVLTVRNQKLSWLIFIMSILAFCVPFLYEDRFMTVGLMRIYSLLYEGLPTPFLVIQKIFDPYVLRDAIHAVFAGGTIYLGYNLLKLDKLNQK